MRYDTIRASERSNFDTRQDETDARYDMTRRNERRYDNVYFQLSISGSGSGSGSGSSKPFKPLMLVLFISFLLSSLLQARAERRPQRFIAYHQQSRDKDATNDQLLFIVIAGLLFCFVFSPRMEMEEFATDWRFAVSRRGWNSMIARRAEFKAGRSAEYFWVYRYTTSIDGGESTITSFSLLWHLWLLWLYCCVG